MPPGGVRDYVNRAVHGKGAYLICAFCDGPCAALFYTVHPYLGGSASQRSRDILRYPWGCMYSTALLSSDFLSNIWAVSVMSPAMRKAVPRNHRRAPSQMQPHPAPDLPPILGLSPSVRVSQARGPNAVQSPDHGYLHFPSNISYCSQLFPVWGCPGMRCLCVGRQSHRPMEAVI